MRHFLIRRYSATPIAPPASITLLRLFRYVPIPRSYFGCYRFGGLMKQHFELRPDTDWRRYGIAGISDEGPIL